MTTVVYCDAHVGDRDHGPEFRGFVEHCNDCGFAIISAGDLANNTQRWARTLAETDDWLWYALESGCQSFNVPGNHDWALRGAYNTGAYRLSSFYVDGSRLITHGTGIGSPDKFWRQDGRWPRLRRRTGEAIIELGDWSERRLHKDTDNVVMRFLKRAHDVVVPRGRRIDDEAWLKYAGQLVVKHARKNSMIYEIDLGHTHRAGKWEVSTVLTKDGWWMHWREKGQGNPWNDKQYIRLDMDDEEPLLHRPNKTAVYNCGAWVPSNETHQVAGTSTTIERGEVGAFCVRWEDDGPSEFLRWQDGELREVV